MSHFHPQPEWLTEYAAGSLAWPYSLAVGVHLHYCPVCRASVQQLNAVGGALLEELTPRPVSADLKSRVMALLDDLPQQHKPVRTAPDVPALLKRWIPEGYADLRWRRVLPVLREVLLEKNRDTKIALHRISPGGKITQHSHTGQEITVVLAGHFSDELGMYQDGDFILRTGEHQHSPRASQNEECICLTIVQGGLKVSGLLGVLVNPFLR